MTETEERGRTEERGQNASLLPIANEKGEMISTSEVVGGEHSGLEEASPPNLPPPTSDD